MVKVSFDEETEYITWRQQQKQHPHHLTLLSFRHSANPMKQLVFACLVLAAVLMLMIGDNPALAKDHKHVQINVWRGPSKGHKKHKFAPWGFHAKLPADKGKGHHGWCTSTNFSSPPVRRHSKSGSMHCDRISEREMTPWEHQQRPIQHQYWVASIMRAQFVGCCDCCWNCKQQWSMSSIHTAVQSLLKVKTSFDGCSWRWENLMVPV